MVGEHGLVLRELRDTRPKRGVVDKVEAAAQFLPVADLVVLQAGGGRR
jgi:hypothetical protein